MRQLLVEAFQGRARSCSSIGWVRLVLRLGLACSCLPSLSRGAEDGAQVVILYNSAIAESRAVALHYAQRRGVPEKQVLGLKLSTTPEMSRAEYRDLLLQPLLRMLTNSGLMIVQTGPAVGTDAGGRSRPQVVQSSIRYLVVCYGVPWRIKPDAGLYEPETDSLRPELRRNEAALDSELACLPLALRGYPLVGPFVNPHYGCTNAAQLHPTNGLLLVSRLDGPTPEIARALVDKAIEAERDGLWGRAYFDCRGSVEPGLQPGEEMFRNAAEMSRLLGLPTVLDTNESVFPVSYPLSQVGFYAGWYAENITGALARPTVEFMPGAFAYHLHSFAAADLRSTNRHWVGPLLHRGATVTLGPVYEPYLGGTPDLTLFISRFVLQGFSFGEAAWASQPALSWQITVVGDPLYRPFGRPPSALHADLESRQSALVAWSHLRLVNLNLARGTPLAEMVTYLEQCPVTRHSAVLTEKLGDLYDQLGKPHSAALMWQRALALDPSPQQRLRLLLAVAERFESLQQWSEAYEARRSLLRDYGDQLDRAELSRSLAALAARLGKSEEARQYQQELESVRQSATNSASTRSP
ncbi:MAG: TIGR03790 family protein [Verrucomicrobiota bacterium]|nr:TIGR03790 family protein [Limisphaera sp.]MDW8382977.1 TIGR03790 family protein [Verrucomicrobiota bacterium]